MAAGEVTQKLKIDLSDVKREMADAQASIRMANTEFKKSILNLDSWQDSSEGVAAKIRQLSTTLDAEKKKLSALNEQYARTVAVSGQNSAEAQRLAQRIADQELKIAKTEKSLKDYGDRLQEVQAAEQESASGLGRLTSEIADQETELASLKESYENVIIEQGKASQEAQELGSKISALSSDLSENKAKLDNAKKAADDLDASLDTTGDVAEDTGEGFTVLKGALADLVADGIKGAVSELKDFATEAQEANSKFQASTGASADEMEEFSEEMQTLYEQGYGESLEDIGDKMAYIKKVTGEVDPSKLGEMTENAMTLEDTFGSDFEETLRGVQSLMNHFGIDAETAFDLFAAGSQEGLDYTQELGDNVSEYAGKFAEAGYSAEEYFQLLQNGSQGGAYNLDKVNDAVNEMTTRLGDGTIEGSLDMFSTETQSVFKEWQNGGATQKDVIDAIVADIKNTTSEEEKMGKAAEAFGTMAEDGGTQFIESLSSVGDSFDDVQGKMEDVKNTRYDNVSSQLKSIGRTAKTEILAPLGEKILPKVEETLEFAIENSDELIPIVEKLGAALTAAFAIGKIQPALTAITAFASSNPIGLIITGLAGLYAANQVAAVAAKAEADETYGLSQAQEEQISKINELNDAYNQTTETRNTNEASVNSEYDNLERLASEYDTYLDKNGEVEECYEDRANFIENTLSESLGIEKEDLKNLAKEYGNLSGAVSDTIEQKRAEAVLDAGTEAYTEAIQNQTQAEQDLAAAKSDLDDAQAKYDAALANGSDALEKYNAMVDAGSDVADSFYENHKKEIMGIESAKEALDEEQKAYDTAQETVTGYNTTIQNYEGLSSAIISGDSAKIAEALQMQTNNFQTAETGTKESLQKQVDDYQSTYEQMKAAVEDGSTLITEAQVSEAKNMVDMATAELDKLSEASKTSGENSSTSFAQGIAAGSPKIVESTDQVKSAAETELSLASGKAGGINLVTTFTSSSKSTDATSGASSAKTKAQNTINTATGATGGAKLVSSFNAAAKNADAASGASAAKNKAETTIKKASGKEGGTNFVDGFVKGIRGGLGVVGNAAVELASKALSALKNKLKSHSPSKETGYIGDDFDAGFVNHIAGGTKKVVAGVTKMAEASLEALADGTEISGSGSIGAFTSSIASGRVISGGTSGGGTTIENNFYQTNNSPKSLSRLEIYRQTHNLLQLNGGA